MVAIILAAVGALIAGIVATLFFQRATRSSYRADAARLGRRDAERVRTDAELDAGAALDESREAVESALDRDDPDYVDWLHSLNSKPDAGPEDPGP